MNNKEKKFVLDWNLLIAIILGSIVKDVVEGFIGFKRTTNGFNSLNFVEDILIFLICALPLYLLVRTIRKRN
ncbi:hypothetical protein K9O30_22360 [Clostridium bowmanii]|uniref:hypothetical protein n=1 Tax=Clostridium bowmanii TaxID=132925 RepID=UPI001C0DCF56|nr:hypothetical protein [Clostridium bowmanii]MBU3192134.1 hypothetical protein [Clostridium bowmanii]MCA1076402.1 hypothetical protein [Clostridium bowmanii]